MLRIALRWAAVAWTSACLISVIGFGLFYAMYRIPLIPNAINVKSRQFYCLYDVVQAIPVPGRDSLQFVLWHVLCGWNPSDGRGGTASTEADLYLESRDADLAPREELPAGELIMRSLKAPEITLRDGYLNLTIDRKLVLEFVAHPSAAPVLYSIR
jgi:hypothetical protein